MAETIASKYRAFLSYSHKDTAWAKWLHGRLEGFRIDKDLIGRETPVGPVPEMLRPIFRDRDDFSGGHTLTQATVTALDASAALIVLCSTVAAGRPAVNEEVRLFRSRHPDRPVIPVIIDGTWPDNFPPALRYELAADGAVTDRPITILGPDLRERADGKSLGLAKTIAGLTGLAPDDVYRRAERERRKQERLRAAVVAVIVVLAIIGGGFSWQSYQQKQTLAEISALVDKYSLAGPAQAVPGAKVTLTQALTNIAEGAATDPGYAKALELLKAGKAAAAEPLLKAVAEDRARRADKDAKDAAAAYRTLASIAGLGDPKSAREAYGRAVALDPDDREALYWLGWLQLLAGNLVLADRDLNRLLHVSTAAHDDRGTYRAYLRLGEVFRARGNLQGARDYEDRAYDLARRNADRSPDDLEWRRDLSVAYEKVGDVQAAQGNLPAALTSHQASLAIAERLAKSGAGKDLWQRDLSVAYEKVGDVQVAQGNLPAALTSYQAEFAIRDRLATSVAGHALWQRDLSVAYEKVGDAQMAQGNLPAALTSYQTSLAIAERLATSDDGNAGWRRDLSVAYAKVGDVQVAERNLPAALASYQTDLAIRERLAKSDADNAVWQRDLSVSYERVGDVQMAQGDLSAALTSYQASLTVAERLAKSDGGNALWQHDLAVAYSKLGDVLAKQGRGEDAVQNYRLALAVMERLADVDATNRQWQTDVIEFNYDLAINGDKSADRFAYVAASLRKLKSERELPAEQAGWLAEAETRLAKLQAP